MNSSSIIERIENPENEHLRSMLSDACQTTEDRLEEWGFSGVSDATIRRLSYTYYHRSDQDDPKYVFLVQDPGGLQRRHTEELDRIRSIEETENLDSLVDVYREFPKSWLLRNRNSDFSEQFFSTLADHGLISYETSWRPYLQNEQFYDDFYMTDVVKYRVDGSNKSEERASVDAFLREELSNLDPELIFSFGRQAWEVLRDHFGAWPVSGGQRDMGKISEMHGQLCETRGQVDTMVLPLSHMSGQVWWRFPPEEYISRMEDGIEEWKSLD